MTDSKRSVKGGQIRSNSIDEKKKKKIDFKILKKGEIHGKEDKRKREKGAIEFNRGSRGWWVSVYPGVSISPSYLHINETGARKGERGGGRLLTRMLQRFGKAENTRQL